MFEVEIKIPTVVVFLFGVMIAHGSAARPASSTIIDAHDRGSGLNRLSYAGRWEFVAGIFDGRLHGRSARSFHAGDDVTLFFYGRRLRIFGITGPSGGVASLSLGDGSADRDVSFYSSKRLTHALVYSSPLMPSGRRLARLIVTPPADLHRTYVNLDEFEVSVGNS